MEVYSKSLSTETPREVGCSWHWKFLSVSTSMRSVWMYDHTAPVVLLWNKVWSVVLRPSHLVTECAQDWPSGHAACSS